MDSQLAHLILCQKKKKKFLTGKRMTPQENLEFQECSMSNRNSNNPDEFKRFLFSFKIIQNIYEC